MKKFLLAAFASVGVFATASLAQPQSNCPPGYVPQPNQDCKNALVLCNRVYQTPDTALCGRGLVQDLTRASCGTAEHISSYYQFTVRSNGKLNFLILPNDVRDTANLLSDGGSRTDYDYALYAVPAGSIVNQQTCYLFDGVPSPYEAACDYSGIKGATGMWTPVVGQKFDTAITVQAGQTFLLHVDNFSTTNVGYKIIFRTPQDGPQYADVTTPTGLQIESIGYDPNCQGTCPAVLQLNQRISTQGLQVQVYDPSNLGRRFNAFVASRGPVSDTLFLFGDFSALDSTLSIVLRSDSTPLQYSCGGRAVAIDTIPLRVANRRRPNAYYTITGNRSALEAQFAVAPNPFSQSLAVRLPQGSAYRVRVIDATGKQVYLVTDLPGGQTHSLALPASLPRGLYYVEASGQSYTFRKRMVRE